jgi:hypothetical protein
MIVDKIWKLTNTVRVGLSPLATLVGKSMRSSSDLVLATLVAKSMRSSSDLVHLGGRRSAIS